MKCLFYSNDDRGSEHGVTPETSSSLYTKSSTHTNLNLIVILTLSLNPTPNPKLAYFEVMTGKMSSFSQYYLISLSLCGHFEDIWSSEVLYCRPNTHTHTCVFSPLHHVVLVAVVCWNLRGHVMSFFRAAPRSPRIAARDRIGKGHFPCLPLVTLFQPSHPLPPPTPLHPYLLPYISAAVTLTVHKTFYGRERRRGHPTTTRATLDSASGDVWSAIFALLSLS